MPMPSCAPPDSLTLWTAALLAGMGLLVVVALALESAHWRVSRRALALRLSGALFAVGLAGWSLLLYARVQTTYDALAARNDNDPTYCILGGFHGPPWYDTWQRMVAAQIAPVQRAALITTSITIAFVLVVVVVAALSRLRSRRQARMQIRWSAERGRTLALALLLTLILASLGDFAVIQIKSVQAQMALNAPCPSSMTDADIQHLRDAGVPLTLTEDTVPVSAQQARTASRQGLGALLPANATCVTPQLCQVDTSSAPGALRFGIYWVVGWRTPATLGSAGVVVIPPTVQWTFVDAQSGEYDGNIFIAVVGG